MPAAESPVESSSFGIRPRFYFCGDDGVSGGDACRFPVGTTWGAGPGESGIGQPLAKQGHLGRFVWKIEEGR